MNISIVLGLHARQTLEFECDLPEGSQVVHALAQLHVMFPPFYNSTQDWSTAIWGKPQSLDALLKPGDRIEVLRSLRVDPKVARRERFQKQGSRAAGLFANRRAGAKQGY